MAPSTRRRARIVALQALYESDSSSHEPLAALARIAREERLGEEQRSFAASLVRGVLEDREAIDRSIGEVAPAWPVEQLAAVDRNILRLAIREMRGDNGTPVRAVINEAVELAKRFGSESSPRFINGVLGAIAREGRADERDLPAGKRR